MGLGGIFRRAIVADTMGRGSSARLSSNCSKGDASTGGCNCSLGKAWRAYLLCSCDSNLLCQSSIPAIVGMSHWCICCSVSESVFGLSVRAQHISDTANILTDNLSHNTISFFLSHGFNSPHHSISRTLGLPDCTSLSWKAVFSAPFGEGLCSSVNAQDI